MAPATGYGTATITNPSGALTDFSLMIDLSTMHADWWTEQNDADGTKGRAYKNDGTTELAVDWIDFNGAGETGWLRVKWSGTLASSGTQIIRIYPPHSGNASVAAGDAFGSDNAYDASWMLYLPPAGGNDRTSNANNGTASGGVSVGGSSGPFGPATTFDGDDDLITVTDDPTLDVGTGDFSLFVWAETVAGTAGGLIEKGGAFVSVPGYVLYNTTPTGGFTRTWDNPDDIFISFAVSQDTWTHIAMTCDRDGNQQNYIDGSAGNSGNMSAVDTLDNAIDFLIGKYDLGFWEGDMGEVQLHKTLRSAAWVGEEHAQTDDQSAFWGTWGWTAAAGGGIVILRRRRS